MGVGWEGCSIPGEGDSKLEGGNRGMQRRPCGWRELLVAGEEEIKSERCRGQICRAQLAAGRTWTFKLNKMEPREDSQWKGGEEGKCDLTQVFPGSLQLRVGDRFGEQMGKRETREEVAVMVQWETMGGGDLDEVH